MALDLNQPRRSRLGRGRVPEEVRRRIEEVGDVTQWTEDRIRTRLCTGRWDAPSSWNIFDPFDRESSIPHHR